MKKNRAVAIAEFILTIPLLVLLFVGTTEIGRFFYQYMVISNIAYAAVRFGIQLNTINPYCFESNETHNIGYVTSEPTGAVAAHWLAQRRAAVMLDEYKNQLAVTGSGPGGSPDLASEFILDPTVAPSSNCLTVRNTPSAARKALQNTFAVKVEATYTPLFLGWSFPVRATSRSSYLFNNERFPAFKDPPGGSSAQRGF